MKKLMMVVTTTAVAWCSWGAERILVKEVANHYPWDGKVDCVVTLSGMDNGYLYNGAFELSVKKNGEIISRVVTNELGMVDGTYTNTFDCTALFGAGYYPNGSIVVALVKLDYVQLWAGGPSFAIRNVGATKPEKYGYYFCWGDTVGYKRNANNDGWISVKDGSVFAFNDYYCQTGNMSIDQLMKGGWINANTNLVAEHDAATVHLGAPWRLPTGAEMRALQKNCTTTWVENWKGTGVSGRLFTGKGGYALKSIFLPAVGYGNGSLFVDEGAGVYWSSEPSSSYSNNALYLRFTSSSMYMVDSSRCGGAAVRPVR